MTTELRGVVLASLATASILLSVCALGGIVGCSSSKSKLTPEQRAEIDLEQYQEKIREVVKDPARAKKLIALSSEFQHLVQEGSAGLDAYRNKLDLLNSSYTSTRAEYDALFAEQDSALKSVMEKAVKMREQMAALTTESEWTELKKARVTEWQAEIEEMRS